MAVSVPGAPGGVPSGFEIAVFMSEVISAGESARLYTRTSSMRPLKYSPQIALPPILSGKLEVEMAPLTASWETWLPLT